ncbi:hypothetical protein GCM10017776_19250 [Streptomyces griseoluteus]|nr:hypothetical protein GCM10017776_19250 [Streptomyces griseoluteus]
MCDAEEEGEDVFARTVARRLDVRRRHHGVRRRHPHASAGLPRRTGESVIPVDGDGTVRRRHFVPAAFDNLYDGLLPGRAPPRPCPLTSCDCHIGYVHPETLPLYDVFAGGVLERIPAAVE